MTPGASTSSISPLPAAAAEIPPAIAAVEVTPAAGQYPETAVVGQPFEVGARAFPPKGAPPLRGVVRWRKVLSPRWGEETLQELGDNAFAGRWTPGVPGDYEWCVELWAGDAHDPRRPGSSGAEVLHRLRAYTMDFSNARWKKAPRAPLADLHPADDGSTDVLLLDPIFPQAGDGRPGRDGVGHYSIDPELGDTRDFGELSAAARRAGVTLALTTPLDCSPGHPLRLSHPEAFGRDGALDWTGASWRQTWSAWEGVFRFWVVQGIDLFHIPSPGDAPVSFWQELIEHLRDDFPATAFTANAEELDAYGPHLTGAGFVPAPADWEQGIVTPARESAPDLVLLDDASAIDPLPLLDDEPAAAAADDDDGDRPPGEDIIACSCSNSSLATTLHAGRTGLVLRVENSDPGEHPIWPHPPRRCSARDERARAVLLARPRRRPRLPLVWHHQLSRTRGR